MRPNFRIFVSYLCVSLLAWMIACTTPSTPSEQTRKEQASDAGGKVADKGTTGDAGAPSDDKKVPELETDGKTETKVAGKDVTIDTFQSEHVFFGGGKNKRIITKTFEFPEAKYSYDQVKLRFSLDCPNRKCDWWDRFGTLSVVLNPGEKNEQVVELNRFVTAYRVKASWVVDVTPFRPLLTGKVALRIYIDTWVGPGHQNGDGWLVSASFVMKGGTNTPMPFKILPIYGLKNFTYGNPKLPVAESMPPKSLTLPKTFGKAVIRSFITGHGQGNAQNCAEFCAKEHAFLMNGRRMKRKIWRNDCNKTPAQPQYGTWQYARAGWCPGAEVVPWTATVTDALKGGGEVKFEYEVEKYVNTCRPDSPQCTGCMRNWGNCKYNYNGHTKPYFYVSSVLLLYK